LLKLPGVDINLADALFSKGFYSVEELSRASVEDLVTIGGLDEEGASRLIEAAQQPMEKIEEPEEATETASSQEALPQTNEGESEPSTDSNISTDYSADDSITG
jgi:N utilization substance protein A